MVRKCWVSYLLMPLLFVDLSKKEARHNTLCILFSIFKKRQKPLSEKLLMCCHQFATNIKLFMMGEECSAGFNYWREKNGSYNLQASLRARLRASTLALTPQAKKQISWVRIPAGIKIHLLCRRDVICKLQIIITNNHDFSLWRWTRSIFGL